MFGKKYKITFREAVVATHWLLSTVNENKWISHFASYRNGNTDGFTNVYGGMGSFNDLVLCKANNHRIENDKEPLANELLNCLSSIAYTAAGKGELTAHEAITACGNIGSELSGWRCRDCGYGELSPDSIYSFAAYYDVRQAIETGIKTESFLDSIKAVWNQFNSTEKVNRFRKAVKISEISLSQSTGWMRPCPKCQKEDTCVYRWDFNGRKFVPSQDNLAVKKR